MNYTDLEILEEGINHLDDAINCFANCDEVSEEEFNYLVKFIDKLENKKIKLENELKSYRLEMI